MQVAPSISHRRGRMRATMIGCVPMQAVIARVCLALIIAVAPAAISQSRAQDFFQNGWLLNPELSNVYMQTVKANAIFETHRFDAVEGEVGPGGKATVKIDLASINSSIDVRDVRLRFLLFETYKFPFAEVKAEIDQSKLQELLTATRIEFPLTLTLSMHGVVQAIKTKVWVTRINDTTVSVATIEPIIVTAESVALTKNIAKLVEVISGTPIATAASITFDLVFGTGKLAPALAAARASREATRAKQAALPITEQACETRLSVITETGAIYFETASAVLDAQSEPLLKSVADVANRCPAVTIDVGGHTDNVGDQGYNQRLSEERAKSVANYLAGQGVSPTRIRAAGYGSTRTVGSNSDAAGRAKNRRIEFKIKKQ